MKNKAMLLALIDDKEKAAKTAQIYLEMAIPMSKLMRDERAIAVQRQMEEIENMGPQQAKAVSVEDMMRQEGERQSKSGEPNKIQKPVQVQLQGAALAAHLNKLENQKPAPAVQPIGRRPLPRSQQPGKPR